MVLRFVCLQGPACSRQPRLRASEARDHSFQAECQSTKGLAGAMRRRADLLARLAEPNARIAASRGRARVPEKERNLESTACAHIPPQRQRYSRSISAFRAKFVSFEMQVAAGCLCGKASHCAACGDEAETPVRARWWEFNSERRKMQRGKVFGRPGGPGDAAG